MNWKYTSRTTAKHNHNFLTQWLKQTCKIDNTCINKNNLSELLTCHTVVGWCFLCIHTGQMSCYNHYCKHRQYHNHILAWNQKRVLSNDYSTITRNIAAITGNKTLQWGIQWGTATINEKRLLHSLATIHGYLKSLSSFSSLQPSTVVTRPWTNKKVCIHVQSIGQSLSWFL